MPRPPFPIKPAVTFKQVMIGVLVALATPSLIAASKFAWNYKLNTTHFVVDSMARSYEYQELQKVLQHNDSDAEWIKRCLKDSTLCK